MKKIFNPALLVATFIGMFAIILAPVPAIAGPFDGAIGEACKGANLSNNDKTCESAKAGDTLDKRVQFIVNLLTIVVGIAAVILIIVNGLKFITSNGDSNSITSAKQGIIYAIVGLIIVALAQVIVRFVINRI